MRHEVDREYKSLKRAEEKAEKTKKENHYRIMDYPCCYTCKHSDHGYEGEITCEKLRNIN